MLIFFSGKMGSGKSTASSKLAEELSAVLISEDEWLSHLYPGEISTFDDFLKFSSRLKPLIASHARDLLESGLTVILDFPANTKRQREWFRHIYEAKGYPHRLVYLQATDELCLGRINLRREEQPERQEFDNEQVFKYVTQFFEAPTAEEGFNIEVVNQDNAQRADPHCFN